MAAVIPHKRYESARLKRIREEGAAADGELAYLQQRMKESPPEDPSIAAALKQSTEAKIAKIREDSTESRKMNADYNAASKAQSSKDKRKAAIMRDKNLSDDERRELVDGVDSGEIHTPVEGAPSATGPSFEEAEFGGAPDASAGYPAAPAMNIPTAYVGRANQRKLESNNKELSETFEAGIENKGKIRDEMGEKVEGYKEDYSSHQREIEKHNAQLAAETRDGELERDEINERKVASVALAEKRTDRIDFHVEHSGLTVEQADRAYRQLNDPNVSDMQKNAIKKEIEGSMEIDPQRSLSGVAPKIFAALTMIGSGLIDLGGGRGRGIEILTNNMDRDIAAQIDKKKTLQQKARDSRSREGVVREDAKTELAEHTYQTGVTRLSILDKMEAADSAMGIKGKIHEQDVWMSNERIKGEDEIIRGKTGMTEIANSTLQRDDQMKARGAQARIQKFKMTHSGGVPTPSSWAREGWVAGAAYDPKYQVEAGTVMGGLKKAGTLKKAFQEIEGMAVWGARQKDIVSDYTSYLMNMKGKGELELGVLAGKDLELMTDIAASPTGAFWKSNRDRIVKLIGRSQRQMKSALRDKYDLDRVGGSTTRSAPTAAPEPS